MFRSLTTWVLAVPLSLNGLWVVCADQESAPAVAKTTAAASEATAHCKMLCPTEKPDQTGAICFFSASADGTSIAVFAVAVATPPPAVRVFPEFTLGESIPEQAAFYLNPSLSGLTPPPKA